MKLHHLFENTQNTSKTPFTPHPDNIGCEVAPSSAGKGETTDTGRFRIKYARFVFGKLKDSAKNKNPVDVNEDDIEYVTGEEYHCSAYDMAEKPIAGRESNMTFHAAVPVHATKYDKRVSPGNARRYLVRNLNSALKGRVADYKVGAPEFHYMGEDYKHVIVNKYSDWDVITKKRYPSPPVKKEDMISE